jgi:hypothetical protein
MEAPQKQSQTLGIVALILAIVGFILTVAALQTLIIGIALGFGGMIVGIIATTQRRGTGMAIAAIVIGILCPIVAPFSCIGHAVNTVSLEETSKPINTGSSSADKQIEYQKGEVATVGSHTITVTGIVAPYPMLSYTPRLGYQFVKVTIKITNTSNQPYNFNPSDYKLEDSRKVQNEAGPESYSSEEPLTSGTLASGGEVVGSMVYEIPTSSLPQALLAYAGYNNPPVRLKLQ